MATGAWAIPYKNPMAIIQSPADQWQGLIGTDKGKLKFDTMSNGVRAGIINLYNAYFKRGNNTLIGIFSVYAPKGDGANNPVSYANTVSKLTGLSINQKLIFEDVVEKLARAIIKVETGSNISDNDYNKGLFSALDRLGFILDGGKYTEIVVTGKKKKKQFFVVINFSRWWILII
jgi:hypothetical protein